MWRLFGGSVPVQANSVNHENVSNEGKLAFSTGDSFGSGKGFSFPARWYSGKSSTKKWHIKQPQIKIVWVIDVIRGKRCWDS